MSDRDLKRAINLHDRTMQMAHSMKAAASELAPVPGSARSNRAVVRNPLLALPSAQALMAHPDSDRSEVAATPGSLRLVIGAQYKNKQTGAIMTLVSGDMEKDDFILRPFGVYVGTEADLNEEFEWYQQ